MKVVKVSSETALQAAVGNLRSATRILIGKGTYTLTRPLVLPKGLADVEIASATGRASDVVLLGAKATSKQQNPSIFVATDATRLTLANLTLKSAVGYPITLRGAMVDPRLAGLRIRDNGQFVAATLDPARGASGGLVENCLFEYVALGSNFPVGIDVSNGQKWVIRGNRFIDAKPAASRIGGPAIFTWGGSRGTLIERNTFVNTSREIVLGLEDRTPDQSERGIVRNNMIVRRANTGFRGAAISILDSPDTVVVHNSVLLAGTSDLAIDYAHRDTSNTYIAGNLLDGSITSRDGAAGLVEGNYLLATPEMFVAPAAADLRLRPDLADAVIDRGIFTEFAPTDFKGQARPSGGAVDIGADEVVK